MTSALSKEAAVDLGLALREHVLPSLGAHWGRAHVHTGAGGDVTFAIDQQAEAFVERYVAERLPEVALYSEDRGLVPAAGGATATDVLVVDPIDGTRPAMAGLECCCASIAVAGLAEGRPTMADVRIGCVVELKTGLAFVAERGEGLELRQPGGSLSHHPSFLSPNTDLATLFWTAGFRGRPAAPLVDVLEELIDTSSVGGGFFDLGSASYDMTRVVTGQLDAYVDVGPRMIEELPPLRQRFEEVGGGAILNNSPYDVAASTLCLEEGGAIVTDARGEPLGPRPLLGSGPDYQLSCVAAANAELHSRLLSAVDRGMRRLVARRS